MADFKNGTGLVALAHLHVARLLAQARAKAVGAGLGAAQAAQVFAYQCRVGLAVAPLHIGDDAFEGVLFGDLFALRSPRVHDVAELDVFLARAEQDRVSYCFRQAVEAGFDVKRIVLGQALQHAEVVAIAPVPAFDGAAGEAECGEGDHARGVEELVVAQAVTGGAGTHGGVERKQPWLQLGNRIVAHRAGELGVEEVFHAAVHLQRNRTATCQAQCGFKALGQTLFQVRAHLDAVDHHIDVVLLGFLEFGQVLGFHGLAVDAKTHITLGLHVGKHFQKLAFLLARHGGEDHELGFFGQGQHRIHHLAHGLALQWQVVVRAKRRAGAGEQQAQVVMDLGNCAYRGPRVVAGGLLLDADGGRQAFDHVHIGLVHQLQKLACVGGQAFHITALALGIQGVKRQAGLA